ncbi:DNA-binding protein HU-alpha [Candidatus Ecksteinia adelgidicola]|nr:DNA-binding protein HU-alpha [Candidatus Ecksteinia adelgidicola]
MNKSQLINVISKKTNFSKEHIKIILKSALDIITQSLKEGNVVQLVGFGTFKVHYRCERIGRNPKTGKKIKILATKVPSFVSSKILKHSLKSFNNDFKSKN